jgi:hypothetical protein
MSQIPQEYPEVVAAEDKMNGLLSQLSKLQVQYSKEITNVLTEIPKNKYHGAVLELCHDQGILHHLNWWERTKKNIDPLSRIVGDTELLSCASKKGDCGAPAVTFKEYAGQLIQQGKSLGDAADLMEAYNLCAKENGCIGFSGDGQEGPYKLFEKGASFGQAGANAQTRAFVKNKSVNIPASAASLSTKSLGVPIQIEYVRLVGVRALTPAEHAAYIDAGADDAVKQAIGQQGLANPVLTSPETPLPLTLVEKTLEMANATRESVVIVGPTQEKLSGSALVAAVSLMAVKGWTTYVRKDQFASLAQLGAIPKGAPVNSWVAGPDSTMMRERCPITCDTECGNYYFVGVDNVVHPIAKGLGTCGKEAIRIRQDMHQFMGEQGFTLNADAVITTPDACAINLLGFKEKQKITDVIAELTSLGEQVHQRVAQLRKEGEGVEQQTGVKQNEYNKVAIAYQALHERMTKALKVSRTTEQMVRDFDERATSASDHYVLWIILIVVLVGVIVYVARK